MKRGESGTGERVLAWKGNPSPSLEQTHWPLRNLVSTVLSVLRLLCLPHQEKIGGTEICLNHLISILTYFYHCPCLPHSTRWHTYP